jgi:mannose/fructose-specific phosphotransferase system component IIA
MRDGQPTIIFTDFLGGSAYAVARQLVHDCQSKEGVRDCAALTGVNLPMLISFVTKRGKLPFAELVEAVRNDGHRGIQ